MTTDDQLDAAAGRLAALLESHDRRVVFAESCTGGLVSATLTRIPGVSAWHCGSAVVYQIETKHCWLGIPSELLADPGPVSPEVAAAMAEGVLAKAPHANFALSVTGHLGPDAPAGQEGLIYIATTDRSTAVTTGRTVISRHVLPSALGRSGTEIRRERQRRAALLVLETAADFLAAGEFPGQIDST